MKIADSSVQMSAKWAATRQHSTRETVQFWNQGQSRIAENSLLNPEQRQDTQDNVLVNISEEGKILQQNSSLSQSAPLDSESEFCLSDRDNEKIKLLEDFIFILTGKRLKFKFPRIKLDNNQISPENVRSAPVRNREGWGLKIDYNEYTRETEKLSFSSKGTVKTSDGKEINFNLNFAVSREFVENKSLSIRAGDALLDPLVINFKNSSAALGDRNYSFDLDCDGKNDNIAFTGSGSGFLALDLNNNNNIDNGSELFGPQTGNGFSELSKYDGDSNGWIDESDEIYSKLRIWTLDDKGEKTLLALGQAGVGAIYLGNVQTQFGLKTGTNETLGQIQKTGIFLKETGEAGTIQHVDLAI